MIYNGKEKSKNSMDHNVCELQLLHIPKVMITNIFHEYFLVQQTTPIVVCKANLWSPYL
jgi:hypothetical protein